MAKGQRKQVQETIDKRIFENLCGIQCTMDEIRSVLGVSEDSLRRWCKNTYGVDFATIRKEKSDGGKASLRRIQFKLAERYPAMAIFLGKQILGQKDNIIVESEDSARDKECTGELINSLKKFAKEELKDDGKGEVQ